MRELEQINSSKYWMVCEQTHTPSTLRTSLQLLQLCDPTELHATYAARRSGLGLIIVGKTPTIRPAFAALLMALGTPARESITSGAD